MPLAIYSDIRPWLYARVGEIRGESIIYFPHESDDVYWEYPLKIGTVGGPEGLTFWQRCLGYIGTLTIRTCRGTHRETLVFLLKEREQSKEKNQ
jgi:hypothetical protein